MTDIRHASLDDLDIIVDFVFKFAEESPLIKSEIIGEKEIRDYAEFFITSPEHLVLLWEDGVFVAGVVNGLFSRNPMVSEIFFYVKPEKRKSGVSSSILEILDDWTKARGISKIVFHLSGDKPHAGSLEKAGYSLAESSYVKDVGE